MPFYEYECSNCGYRDEVLQKITDKPLKKCPACGKSALKKLMSAPVFRLKGAGWYETDFKSDKENKRNLLAEERDEKKPETKADDTNKSADAKPAEAKPPAESKPADKADKKDSAAATKSRAAARSRPARKPAPKAKRGRR